MPAQACFPAGLAAVTASSSQNGPMVWEGSDHLSASDFAPKRELLHSHDLRDRVAPDLASSWVQIEIAQIPTLEQLVV